MQIFVLDYNPKIAASYLSDIHLNKMCLETAQILSSVMVINGVGLDEGMPKPFNINHPVIKAVNTQSKINWLILYNCYLHLEYFKRFGYRHAYAELTILYCNKLVKILENTFSYNKEELTFCRDFKDFESNKIDIVEAFKDYYRYKKSIIKRWKYTNASEPDWLF